MRGPFRGPADAVAEAVLEWQHASAGGVLFLVVYHGRDPGRWSAPVHRVASRSAHIAVGVDMDGIKHVA